MNDYIDEMSRKIILYDIEECITTEETLRRLSYTFNISLEDARTLYENVLCMIPRNQLKRLVQKNRRTFSLSGIIQVLSHAYQYTTANELSKYLQDLVFNDPQYLSSDEAIATLNGFYDYCTNRGIPMDEFNIIKRFRNVKAPKLTFPEGVEEFVRVMKNTDYKTEYYENAIHEFLKYNIVLDSITEAV